MTEPTITCINGRFTRAHHAAVPVADRGFRFGDGVFETIRVEGATPYQWELHLARLEQGMAALGITAPPIDWADFARKTIRKNGAIDGYLRIAVSRGVGSRGYLPFPPGMPATFVIEYLPPLPPVERPYELWLSSWAKVPPQCLPGKFKLAQGVGSTLALQEAHANDCDEALQLTIDGFVSETASANIFWINEGTLYTPSLDTGCLSGTTRDAILRLSPLPSKTVTAGLSALEKAEAVFITNTRLGLHPISAIQPMGWKFNPTHLTMRQLHQALTADRASYRKQHPIWTRG
jgi:branched-subunit amino acid aminotransferase/4-amino-4-deoxychorismate lyase